MNGKWKRRDFLRNTALAGLLAPVAGYWRDLAEAQSIADRKHMVLVFLPNGKVKDNPFVEGSGSSWTFADGFKPYNEFKSDAIAFQQYGFQEFIRAEYGGDHGGHVAPAGVMFTGEVPYSANGEGDALMAPSIDQIVAWDYLRRGLIQDPRRKSLNIHIKGSSFRLESMFGQTPSDYQLGKTYSSRLDPVQMIQQPVDGWDLLFGDIAEASGTSAAELRAFGKSVLDVPRAELEGIKTQLPGEGRAILDKHLHHLRELETSFSSSDGIDPNAIPERPGTMDLSSSNHVAVFDRWAQLIDAAFRLDRTRIATIQFGGCASRFKVPELGLGYVGEQNDSNSGNDHHSYTHWDGSKVPLFMNWYAERVAGLLRTLKGITSGAENLLQRSVVMTGCEFGHNHNGINTPVTLFGQAGGHLSTGRVIQYGNTVADYHKHTGTLLGVCHAMGVTELQNVGNSKSSYQQGPASELQG